MLMYKGDASSKILMMIEATIIGFNWQLSQFVSCNGLMFFWLRKLINDLVGFDTAGCRYFINLLLSDWCFDFIAPARLTVTTDHVYCFLYQLLVLYIQPRLSSNFVSFSAHHRACLWLDRSFILHNFCFLLLNQLFWPRLHLILTGSFCIAFSCLDHVASSSLLVQVLVASLVFKFQVLQQRPLSLRS